MSVGEVALTLVLMGQLHHPRPTDIDRPLNAAAADKIRDYRADYNNRPSNSTSFMPADASTSGRLHCEFVRILFYYICYTINSFSYFLCNNLTFDMFNV